MHANTSGREPLRKLIRWQPSFERRKSFGRWAIPSRLRILKMLLTGPLCVTDICEQMQDTMPAVSQRLKLLRTERLVSYRRQGKHVIYSLADQHITKLVRNGLAHAGELEEPVKWKRNSTTKPS